MSHPVTVFAGTAALLLGAFAVQASGPVLELTGLTFVASRRAANELVLSAERVRLHPEADTADLEVVRARLQGEDGETSFQMVCDRGKFDLNTSDFTAEGNVEGRTRDGVVIRTARARYEHASGLVTANTPVEIAQEGSVLTGDGFEYDARARRLRVLGASRMVQQP